MGSSPSILVDDPKPGQDALNKKRELDLKEREVAAREREVLAKEEELKRSRWLNPTVIGLFAAALGLLGSVIVARVNNANTQAVERLQSEANITLEAIKTGTGNTDAACKNLTFFVSLGLVHDPEGKIATQCKNAPTGPPSLPANQVSTRPQNPNGALFGVVTEYDSWRPISGAVVTVRGAIGKDVTDSNGRFEVFLPVDLSGPFVALHVEKSGYMPTDVNIPKDAVAPTILLFPSRKKETK